MKLMHRDKLVYDSDSGIVYDRDLMPACDLELWLAHRFGPNKRGLRDDFWVPTGTAAPIEVPGATITLRNIMFQGVSAAEIDAMSDVDNVAPFVSLNGDLLVSLARPSPTAVFRSLGHCGYTEHVDFYSVLGKEMRRVLQAFDHLGIAPSIWQLGWFDDRPASIIRFKEEYYL